MNARKLATLAGIVLASMLFATAMTAALFGGTLKASHKHADHSQTVEAPAPIAEDDAAWDCATMGNLQCGPGSVPLSTYCQAEASQTIEGVEVIAYRANTVVWHAGLAYPCPS